MWVNLSKKERKFCMKNSLKKMKKKMKKVTLRDKK